MPSVPWKTPVRDEAAIRQALEEHGWDVGDAAYALGYSRSATLWKRLKTMPDIMEELNKHPQSKGRRMYTQISDEQFLEAIHKARGIKSLIAKMLRVDLTGVYERINRNPAFQEACRVASEGFKDVAETKLFDLVEAGDFQAIKYYLSTQARDRGYGDRIDINASMNVTHSWDLTSLSVDELRVLENIARKALPAGDNEPIDGEFTEVSA